jgi:hypothetical protein
MSWQDDARELGIPFVGRKKVDVLADIQVQLDAEDAARAVSGPTAPVVAPPVVVVVPTPVAAPPVPVGLPGWEIEVQHHCRQRNRQGKDTQYPEHWVGVGTLRCARCGVDVVSPVYSRRGSSIPACASCKSAIEAV